MMMEGRVYDRGYRPFEGTLGGRGAARLALFKATIRRALGIRRSWRQKVFPWLLLAIVSVPAIVQVGIGYVTRDTPASDFEFITYREYVGVSTALLLFVALTAPDVICPDRRQRVLPLIFSRPLTGADYVAARLGGIVAIVFAFGVLPQVVLFVGQMLVSDDGALDYATANADVLWKVPVAVALMAVFFASMAVAMAAATTRRLIAAAAFLITLFVSGIVTSVADGTAESEPLVFGPIDPPPGWVAATNLLRVPFVLRDLVFEGELVPDGDYLHLATGAAWWATASYVAVVGLSVASLLRRYRWVEL